MACPLRVGGETLAQVEEYLGVWFTSEGKMEREIDRQIGSDVFTVPVCCGVERAKSEGEALNFLLDPRSHHHL